MKMKKNHIPFRLVFLVGIMILIALLTGIHLKKKHYLNETINTISERLMEKWITDANVTYQKSTRIGGYTIYYISIDSEAFGSLPNAEKVRVYEYVDIPLVITYFYSNGDEYSISTYNDTATIQKNTRMIYEGPTDKKQAKIDQAKEKYGSKMPFEGLEEDYIDCTKLGVHSSVELSKDFYAMKYIRRMKTYKWNDANGNLICSANVFYNNDGEGHVGSVYIPTKTLATPKPSKKPTIKKEADPFNAKDYAHPEDFYEWYYNDFFDYEEAEEYWEKHN